ncbi:MAG: amidohydrolase family protein [Ardenticatenaceae bacterium]|nr:amidohydrolase family protein [Ardenticatenaceae bacterium]
MSAIKAALGQVPVDLLVTNVRVVNVYSGEIIPAEIAIYGERVVAVEPPGSAPRRQAHRTLNGRGQLAVPGLVDSHLHIESTLVTPGPFAEAVLCRGTTTVAEDPHEVANATGLDGVRIFYEASQGLPLHILFLVSTCVPAAAGLEHCQGTLGPREVAEMLAWQGVIGLAEVMDARAVVDEEPRMSEVLEAGRLSGGVIEGHNPMLDGRELMAYIAAGVNSDHTLATPERLLMKLRLGVTIQLQERYMTEAVIAALTGLPLPPATLCLVTDDVAPDALEAYGHLDQVLRRAIALGLPPMQALQAATINPARRLRLYDRGAIAPGRRADIVLVDDLETFRVSTTISDGRIVVEEGRTTWNVPARPGLDALRGSLHLAPLARDDFLPELPLRDGEVRARVILAHGQGTTTAAGSTTLRVVNGEPQLDGRPDLALIAVIARGNVSRFVGFVQGLGLQRGAVATTHAHDSHNLCIIGRDRESMAGAANAVIAADGGIAVAVGETVPALVPLPIAGIISDAPVPAVAAQMRRLTDVLASLGVRHPHLLMRLSTFTLPVSSGLRITDQGYVLAERRAHVSLVEPQSPHT